MKTIVISPTCSKESAERLASLIGAKYTLNNRDDYTDFDVVVNYGCSRVGHYNRIINHPHSVKLCVNKISTFKRVVHGVNYTKEYDVALSWLKSDKAVVSRALEEGSRSEGVMICLNKDALDTVPAKFWTRYFPHEHEVRINVFKDKILTVFEKIEEDGMFIFHPLEIQGEENKEVQQMIQSIRKSIGIDFYGLDVLVNKKGECKLLEINSGSVLMEETEDVLIPLLLKEINNG